MWTQPVLGIAHQCLIVVNTALYVLIKMLISHHIYMVYRFYAVRFWIGELRKIEIFKQL